MVTDMNTPEVSSEIRDVEGVPGVADCRSKSDPT